LDKASSMGDGAEWSWSGTIGLMSGVLMGGVDTLEVGRDLLVSLLGLVSRCTLSHAAWTKGRGGRLTRTFQQSAWSPLLRCRYLWHVSYPSLARLSAAAGDTSTRRVGDHGHPSRGIPGGTY
jgi:hypothetical protein